MKQTGKIIFTFGLIVSAIFFSHQATYSQNNSREITFANETNFLFDEEDNIFELINRQRNRKSLSSLVWNDDLADVARNYSRKMARERFFSHYDREGKAVNERVAAMKITRWKVLGENLFMAEGYDEFAQVAVKGWMESKYHRQNILDGRFNQTGIGAAKSRDGTVYITQVFMGK
jgi:uncharacterized protein YkwD